MAEPLVAQYGPDVPQAIARMVAAVHPRLDVSNHTSQTQRVLVDFAVHYIKANGQSRAKVPGAMPQAGMRLRRWRVRHVSPVLEGQRPGLIPAWGIAPGQVAHFVADHFLIATPARPISLASRFVQKNLPCTSRQTPFGQGWVGVMGRNDGEIMRKSGCSPY